MSRRVNAIILTILTGIVFCGSSGATQRGFRVKAQLPEGGELPLYQNSYALVIGVSDYDDDRWNDLGNAVPDAREVAKALQQRGFEVSLMENPDYETMEKKLKDLEFKTGVDDDRLLFFFAGHGETETLANDEELGYIVLRDTPLRDVDPRGFMEKAVSMERLAQSAKRLRFKHVLYVFDSCFSGSIFALQQRAAPKNISEKTAKKVRQFITAGGKDETVPDESVFKQVLLAALEGDGDLTEDGYITGTELGMYLRNNVINYSNGTQHPQAGKIKDPKLDKGDFVFVLGPSAAPAPAPAPVAPALPPPPPPVGYHLQVNVNVEGCRVYVDNLFRGQASPGLPLNLQNLNSSAAAVRVEADGYQSTVRQAVLKASQWTQLIVELVPVRPQPPPQVQQPPPEPKPKKKPKEKESDDRDWGQPPAF